MKPKYMIIEWGKKMLNLNPPPPLHRRGGEPHPPTPSPQERGRTSPPPTIHRRGGDEGGFGCKDELNNDEMSVRHLPKLAANKLLVRHNVYLIRKMEQLEQQMENERAGHDKYVDSLLKRIGNLELSIKKEKEANKEYRNSYKRKFVKARDFLIKVNMWPDYIRFSHEVGKSNSNN